MIVVNHIAIAAFLINFAEKHLQDHMWKCTRLLINFYSVQYCTSLLYRVFPSKSYQRSISAGEFSGSVLSM